MEKRFLSSEEVESINSALHDDIENYIQENIVNWEEQCECDEEGDALDYKLDRETPSWRVQDNGTVDVIIEADDRDHFNFSWNDEEGEERISNALRRLKGNVSHKFDDSCNNKIYWNDRLTNEIKSLFGAKEEEVKEDLPKINFTFTTCPECGSKMQKFCMCQLKK
jgi:hypothetical protein